MDFGKTDFSPKHHHIKKKKKILVFTLDSLVNSTHRNIEPPGPTQDWETDSWRAQTEPCAHQDPEERGSDPTRD